MKRPITPNQREPIKAEHLRSHAEAIQWLYEKIKNIRIRNTPSSDSLGSSEYIPWKPNFFTDGTVEVPVYKVRFNLGTVNNVPATNWNDGFTMDGPPAPEVDETFKFVIITVTSVEGVVSGVEISLDASPPTEDEVNEDSPPTTHKIVLGAVGNRSTPLMIANTNLNLAAVEVFRKSKSSPAEGTEPFNRWWRWRCSTTNHVEAM